MSKPMPILVSEEKGVRSLHFGSEWVQGAMRVARPWHLELAYTREMMACLLFRPREHIQKILMIGLGAASLAKFVYKNMPHARTTVVEIDEGVVATAHMQFKLPMPDARLQILVEDGVHFMEHNKGVYDLIIVDGYDEKARVGQLNSESFYRAAHARLKKNGLFVCNMLSRNKTHLRSLKNLGQVFGEHVIAFDSTDMGNVIGFAGKLPVLNDAIQAYKPDAEQLRSDTGLNLWPSLAVWAAQTHRSVG